MIERPRHSQPALPLATVAVWLAAYSVWTSNGMVRGHPNPVDVMGRRVLMAVIGAGLCWVISLGLKATEHSRFPIRLSVAVASCLWASLTFGVLNHFVFYEVSPHWTPDAPQWFAGAILSAGRTIWIFSAWCAIYFALRYDAELRDRDQRLAEMESLAVEAQHLMLREQVNPHFLFNTLTALSALILDRETQRANELLTALARYLRRSLERDPPALVTLADEFEARREYLAIEQVRFADRLAFRMDLPADLADALAPNLILQPVIESAVKYGVSATAHTVTITLSATADQGVLRILMEDDRAAGPDQTVPGADPGLQAVRRRLASVYGAEGRLHCNASPSGGFSALMELPLVRA